MLPVNTGGRTRINAYWYPSDPTLGPCILLQDNRHGEYLLRLQERKTYLIIRYRGRVFAGEIYDKSIGSSCREAKSSDGENEISVSVGDRPAMDITDTAVGKEPGSYFGRIDEERFPLRFLPAAEVPEEKIHKTR